MNGEDHKAIPCGLCGRPIQPGDAIALYPITRPRQAGARVIWPSGEPSLELWRMKFVACIRGDCCKRGNDYAGHWDGQSLVPSYENGKTHGEAIAHRLFLNRCAG